MSFYKKYELDRLMADGDAKTFRAVENATGRVVFLHLFNPSGQPLLAALKSKLGGAQGKPVAPLIEIGEFAGAQYAVTQAIEPFGNLRDWMAQHVAGANPLLGIPIRPWRRPRKFRWRGRFGNPLPLRPPPLRWCRTLRCRRALQPSFRRARWRRRCLRASLRALWWPMVPANSRACSRSRPPRPPQVAAHSKGRRSRRRHLPQRPPHRLAAACSRSHRPRPPQVAAHSKGRRSRRRH